MRGLPEAQQLSDGARGAASVARAWMARPSARLVIATLLLTVLATGCAHSKPRVDVGSLLGELRLSPAGVVSTSPSELHGRVLLIHFTATWCFPCTTDLPIFKALHEKYVDSGLSVIGIGMDLEGTRVLEPFASFQELRFPLLVANERIRKGESLFGRISVLPTTMLIGRDGEVLTVFSGPSSARVLEEEVKKALSP